MQRSRARGENVESIAICFLHSYRRPDHEQRALAIVRDLLPDVYVTASFGHPPRISRVRTHVNSRGQCVCRPQDGSYLERFRSRIQDVGIPVVPYTIHSNGGLMSIETVKSSPVRTCVSGPAAGVVGAAEIGRVAGFSNLITFDVGGTSTDVSLVANSEPLFTSARLVAGYPVKTPMLDIHVIGAGGGSVAQSTRRRAQGRTPLSRCAPRSCRLRERRD